MCLIIPCDRLIGIGQVQYDILVGFPIFSHIATHVTFIVFTYVLIYVHKHTVK